MLHTLLTPFVAIWNFFWDPVCTELINVRNCVGDATNLDLSQPIQWIPLFLAIGLVVAFVAMMRLVLRASAHALVTGESSAPPSFFSTIFSDAHEEKEEKKPYSVWNDPSFLNWYDDYKDEHGGM